MPYFIRKIWGTIRFFILTGQAAIFRTGTLARKVFSDFNQAGEEDP